jgi:SagB-type dehydrogenase family enzyme
MACDRLRAINPRASRRCTLHGMGSDTPVDDGKRGFVTGLIVAGWLSGGVPRARAQEPGGALSLPAPSLAGGLSLEQSLQRRRSRRGFRAEPLMLAEVAQLLWAAQGRTDDAGHRTAPSAGALYPLELTLVAGRIDGLAPALYRYLPDDHALRRTGDGDRRAEVAACTRGQAWVAEAPALLVIAAAPQRTRQRYGARGDRFVALEAGGAAQNLALQAAARGWATVLVGAFDEPRLRDAAGLDLAHEPLVLMPIGRLR